MKTFVFFIALLLSIYFVNDKFSKGVRVIAFSEGETENGAPFIVFYDLSLHFNSHLLLPSLWMQQGSNLRFLPYVYGQSPKDSLHASMLFETRVRFELTCLSAKAFAEPGN